MKRLGLNVGGYLGERIDIDELLRRLVLAAQRHGWTLDYLPATDGLVLPVLTRRPRREGLWTPRVYISAGIHGDEPAGPLAVEELLTADALPPEAWYWICPCLNPSGCRRGTRESADGIDLNRDYRTRHTPEIRSHVEWLQTLPMFDVAFCLHEDWESAGFYIYELNPQGAPSLAPAMLQSVAPVCPIDESALIDGREASGGLIRPSLDPATRLEWPEAFYLIQNKTRLSYTLEAPSDYPLPVRRSGTVAAVLAAVRTFVAHRPGLPTDDGSPPPR